MPPGVRIATLPDDDVPARLIGGSLKTLLYMAQLASISMDPFFSTLDALHTPDQVAIDLDPQPGATFDQILDVARWVHEVLEQVGVPGFPKTSGSEGLHIFIPLAPGHAVPRRHALLPDRGDDGGRPRIPRWPRWSAPSSKRKDGTIYVDYLQNIEGKTLACAYSARGQRLRRRVDAARPGTRCTPACGPRTSRSTPSSRASAPWATCGRACASHDGADLLAALEKLR